MAFDLHGERSALFRSVRASCGLKFISLSMNDPADWIDSAGAPKPVSPSPVLLDVGRRSNLRGGSWGRNGTAIPKGIRKAEGHPSRELVGLKNE